MAEEAQGLVPVNTQTGELVETIGEAPTTETLFLGISEHPVTQEQATILMAPVKAEEVEIRPDGAVYLSHAGYRRRLNQTFKPRGWALRRLGPLTFDKAHNILYAEYALYTEGHFVSAAIGEQQYFPEKGDSDMAIGHMSYGDAAEGTKSNALMRCCKELGIALECWERDWTEKFRHEFCVQVWVQGKQRPQWRRKTAPPFYGERGLVGDKNAAPAPATANGPASKPKNGGKTVTEKQVKFLWTKVRAAGISEDEFADHIKSKLGVSSSAAIPMSEFDGLLQDIETVAQKLKEHELDDEPPPGDYH